MVGKEAQIKVLRTYPRAVVHMRAQLNREKQKRLGLVFGAGLSRSFGLPSWEDLVKNIANDKRIACEEWLSNGSPSDSLSYKTEMIFQSFKKKKISGLDEGRVYDRKVEYEIAGEWLDIIREHLYGGVGNNIEDEIKDHPYIKKLIPIIKQSQMTITYNFDDYIERTLVASRGRDERDDSRGYEVVTSPWTQFRREEAVIYHPNGIVPLEHMEVPGDRIIFSESTFADQILGNSGGEDVGLLNHLSKNTCLFIGLSLNDETLRNLLSKSARRNPGNFHYYVSYTGDHEQSSDHQEAITRTNFQVYNLITMFLGDAELAALADLICMEHAEFKDLAEECGTEIHYRFYLTGPLGVGKSTTIHHVRNLVTYDEWVDQRIPILAKPWDELEEDEKAKADEWILGQFKVKNKQLRHAREGISVIDRGPMDPIAFTPKDERADKASRLIDAYSPGEAQFHVMPGTLLFLDGDRGELETRLRVSNREEYTSEKLATMADDLLSVYGEDNVKKLDTSGMSVEQMVRRVAEIIHLEEYTPMGMKERLVCLSEGGEHEGSE